MARTLRAGAGVSPARAVEVLLIVAVVGSVLAVGSVHLPVLLVLAALCAGAAALAAITPSSIPRTLGPAAPLVVILALAFYTLLQAAPLPTGWLAVMAPASADIWRRSLLPFGEPGPSWASLSLDPGASVVEALKWSAYAWVFAASSRVASRRGSAWGMSVVFCAGVAAALTTVVHGLAGATKVYGVYQPRFSVAAWHVGPLLNPNNLAGYLNLSAMSGLGLMLARKPVAPRWLIGLGVATVIGVDITSGSRGGVLVLPLGVLALATTLRLGRRDHDFDAAASSRMVPWLFFGVAAAGTALAALGGTEDTWRELYDKNLSKLLMLDWARPMIRDHAWFGIGRGAFESVFPAYRTDLGNTIYSYAESFPAQWIAEWGIPAGLTAMGVFAWLFRPSRLGVHRSAATAGAWFGVAILLLHNLLDLALEVPGVMVGVSAVLGSAWGAQWRGASRGEIVRAERSPQGGRWARPGSIMAASALGIVLAARLGWHDVAQDRNTLYEQYARGEGVRTSTQRAAFRQQLRAAILRHPGEPYFPLLGGLVAWSAKEPNPLPWISRAIERGPDNARTHLLLADILASRGLRAQALMELRLAMERDRGLAGAAGVRANRWARSDEELQSAIPSGPGAADMLVTLAGAQPADAGALRRRLVSDALARNPDHAAAHTAMAHELIGELAAGERSLHCGGANRDACIDSLQRHVGFLETRQPESSEGARLRAQLLRIQGDAAGAERLLAERCASVIDRTACLLARLLAAAESSPPAQLPNAIRDYLASRCAIADDCADAAVVVGDLQAGRGDWGAALTHYGRATREAPTEERWLKLANAAERVGAHAQAADALEKVARIRGGGDADLRARIEEQRAAALNGVVK